MPYAPGSPELEQLLADAKASKAGTVQEAELNDPSDDAPAKESA